MVATVLIQPYRHDELRFAYSYHVYLRWQTHRCRPFPALEKLDAPTLAALAKPLDIHVLEVEASATDVRVLVSLQPNEPVSACASKLKGRTSKWLRAELALATPQDLFSRGYFACTSGKSTAAQVSQYLESQGQHHGYAERSMAPIHVESFAVTPAIEADLQPAHASCVLRFHIVLATWHRQGVFGPAEAEAVSKKCRMLQDSERRFALLKVSFVPDHVHLAVRLHPTASPDRLVSALMDAAQRQVFEQFPDTAIGARIERLWQPSAYLGSFGDLATAQVAAYLER